MNDDELRRQLERRAATSPGETFRRQLLPAVSAAIREGSAEPVVRRGVGPLVALASVAAMVVLLIGLAIVRPPLPPSPAASASPTAGQSSPPAAAREVACSAVSSTGEAIAEPPRFAPTVLDATGLIELCQTGPLDQMGPAAARVWATLDAPRVLHVEWQGTPCDAAATLHFAGSYDAADLLVEYPRGDCDSMGVAHGVTLHMARAVDPDDVAVRAETASGQQGIDWAEVEAADAAFELRIFSPASAFVAGEPIEGINAELVYIGDQPEITLTGVGSLIQAFGVRQLDGPLSPGAGWNEPCVPESVRATIPYVKPFSKSGGFGGDDPNADWYRQFFADPELRLPAGRWQITAYSHFFVGGCGSGAPLLELEASVVIEVVEAATSEPSPPASVEPVPSPSTDPAAIELSTSPPNTSGYCRMAADGGYLAPHPVTGLGVGDPDGTNVRPIIWPFGFTARREADGAVLLWPDGRILAREGDEISFGGGTGNEGIFAACGGFDVKPQPSPTSTPLPPPTAHANPTLPPQPTPETWMACEALPLRLVDRAGVVAGCEAGWVPSFLIYQVDLEPVRNTTGDPRVVDLTYSILDPDHCEGQSYQLEVSPVGDSTTDAPMVIVPREDCEEWFPVDFVGRWVTVRLTLTRPVPGEWIIFHEAYEDRDFRDEDATHHGLETDFVPGRLSLHLSTDRETYAATAPIAVTARLAYWPDFGEPEKPLTVHGAIPQFGFVYEQLDGDGRFWGPALAECQPIVLRPDEPISVTSEPAIRLAPGRWRISVTASFSPDDCGDDPVKLHTFVIVRVRG